MRALTDDDAAALAVVANAPRHRWPEWVRAEDMPLGNWVAGFVGDDRRMCASFALAALRCVAVRLPDDVVAAQARMQDRIDAVALWHADGSETSQRLALDAFDRARQSRAWSVSVSSQSSSVVDRELVPAWIDEAADFAVHTVWSGALRGPLEPPRPHICAGLVAICARRALLSGGVSATESTLLIKRAVTPFGGRRVVWARADGKKLYVKDAATSLEEAHDWAGPAGPAGSQSAQRAHYATIDHNSSTHVYTTKYERIISVYDEDGTLLDALTEERWD